MKKIIICALALLMLAGCGSSKEQESSQNTNEKEETMEVDKGLLNVTITLPSSFFESFDTTVDDYVASVNDEKFKEVTKNDDGSVSITMSKSDYNDFLDSMKVDVDNSIEELLNDENYSFTKIDHNKDYSKFDCVISGSEPNFYDSFSVIMFAMYGGFYQMFAGNQEPVIEVNFINNAGTVVNTWNSNELN